jgi:uncharacterized membrane protein YphA (DoxX/SURF4 family)
LSVITFVSAEEIPSRRKNMSTNKINLALFGAGATGLGILCIVFNDFAPLWKTIPSALPGRALWVDACGCILIAASLGLCFRRATLPGVATIGAYYVFWAIGSAPPIFSELLSFGSWYGLVIASSAISGAWILYIALRLESAGMAFPGRDERSVRVTRVLFGLACIFYGCSHFAFADYTASFLPVWLPGRLGFAYFTGICHVAGGAGIALGIVPRLAATLEAIMMSLFGVLIWVPSFFAHPRPAWAGTTLNQWSELVVNLVLAAAAWSVAGSLRTLKWYPKSTLHRILIVP